MFDYADRYASALSTIIDAGQEHVILECLNRSAFPHLHKDENAETSYRLYFLSGAMYNVFIEWLKKEKRETPRGNGFGLLFFHERLGIRGRRDDKKPPVSMLAGGKVF